MRRILRSPDTIAVAALFFLWLVFFWRLFTPVVEDQVSLISGDFSGQFISFGAYQYSRFADGEIPLWNPYNNGGLPFIADTQAAVFYPPRLLIIAISKVTGGWTYNSLQMEMVAHILFYTLLMYTFIRRLTKAHGQSSIFASFVAAVIAGYSGFMSGYPPVQLAVLEAGIWLPLALSGILEATRNTKIKYLWLVLSGFALGMSWMAGHPQTSWFVTYLLVAYLIFRSSIQKYAIHKLIIGVLLMGVITGGIAAVQLLPGFEYLSRTMRTALNFDAKGGGFPIQDIIQFVLPGAVSLYSPLFIGVSGLILAVIGWTGQQTDEQRERFFWLGAAIVSLALSLGANGALYHALYNIAPGLQFFRGQERAAYLVMNSLAISAGLGVITLAQSSSNSGQTRIRYGVAAFAGIIILTGIAIALLWLGNRESYGEYISPAVLSAVVAAIIALLIFLRPKHYLKLIAILLVFELFTVNIGGINYEPVPASQQPIMRVPPLVERVKNEAISPYRVDGGVVRGEIGIYGAGNTGSLYQIPDIRGISPLFLDGPHAIIQRQLPSEVAWEVFAVNYIFSDAEELVVSSEIIARDYPGGQILNLHQLHDPRPFVLPIQNYVVAANDAETWAILADPAFDERSTLILDQKPEIDLDSDIDLEYAVEFTDYHPERFSFEAELSANALLSIAHVDYRGWQIKVNGDSVNSIRAYGAVTALPLEAGTHHIEFRYNPLSYRIGAVLSLFTWAGMGILALIWIIRVIKNANSLTHNR